MRRTLSAWLLVALALALCPATGRAQSANSYYSLPTFVAAGAVASNAAAISPGLPAGLRWGDLLILACETENEAISIANANGGTWTAVNTPVGTGVASAADAARITVFWSRYNVSQGAPTTSDSGDHQLCRMIAVRGAQLTGNPIHVVATESTEATSDTSWVFPGATSTIPNTLVVVTGAGSLPDAAGTAEFGTPTNTDLSQLTERTDNSVTAGTGGSLYIATANKLTAGTWGNTTLTSANNASKAMISFAIAGRYIDNFQAFDRFEQARNVDDTAADPQASVALAFSTNTTAGSLLVASVTWGTTDVTPTAADTQVNSWAEIGTHCWDGTNNQGLAFFYAENTAGGANTITISFGSSVTSRGIVIAEYSHIATSSALEASATNCNETATTVEGRAWTGHVTTTTTHTLLLATYMNTAPAAFTHSGSFMEVSEVAGLGPQMEHVVALQATQYDGLATTTAATVHGKIAAFKAFVAGGAVQVRRLLFGVGP